MWGYHYHQNGEVIITGKEPIMSEETATTHEAIIVYGHAACPMLPPVISALKLADAPYTYVDIHRDPEARERVREINNGYESVPTLVFPDGSTLTEPRGGELPSRLREQGYRAPVTSYIVGNIQYILVGVVIVYALLKFFAVL